MVGGPALDFCLAPDHEPNCGPPRFAAYVKTEVDRWAAIVRNSGVEAE
jgi:hypothetical protein